MVSPGGLIGVSSRTRTIHNLIGKARDHTFPVLILGETGTGKELVARCIHNSGRWKHSAFVAADCSSLTPTLIESELFGHVRGAFTGAGITRKVWLRPQIVELSSWMKLENCRESCRLNFFA